MRLRHGRVELVLHEPGRRPGPALLLLHPLAASSAWWGAVVAGWPGPVHALDFSGHGNSAALRGGAYGPELLAGDADAALAHLGPAAVAGAGVGAYVALLLAGARPELVPAALLLPGPGLAGGGAWPVYDGSPARMAPLLAGGLEALLGLLERDVRPRDYAVQFAQAARRLLLVEDGDGRPPWWVAVRACGTAEAVSAAEGFARLAEIVSVDRVPA